MASASPTWLTPIVSLNDFGGDAEKYIEHLFSLFKRDFIDTKPVFNGKEVLFDTTNDGGKPATFVHITTEEDATGGRNICLRRCERIEWVRAIIEHAGDPEVLLWKKGQSTRKRYATRLYLFVERENFLVILEEKRRSGDFLITAIYVDYPHQKRKHLRDYVAYKKANP